MLPFGDLRIRVDPEVGMRPSVPDRAPPWVLKLWLDQGAPTTDVLDAYLYLLGTAAAVGGWGGLHPAWRVECPARRHRELPTEG